MNKQAREQKDEFLLANSEKWTCYSLSPWQGERPKCRYSSAISPSLGRFLDLITSNTFSRFPLLFHVFSTVWVYLNLRYKLLFFYLNYSLILTQMRFSSSGKIDFHVSGIPRRNATHMAWVIRIFDLTKYLSIKLYQCCGLLCFVCACGVPSFNMFSIDSKALRTLGN